MIIIDDTVPFVSILKIVKYYLRMILKLYLIISFELHKEKKFYDSKINDEMDIKYTNINKDKKRREFRKVINATTVSGVREALKEENTSFRKLSIRRLRNFKD